MTRRAQAGRRAGSHCLSERGALRHSLLASRTRAVAAWDRPAHYYRTRFFPARRRGHPAWKLQRVSARERTVPQASRERAPARAALAMAVRLLVFSAALLLGACGGSLRRRAAVGGARVRVKPRCWRARPVARCPWGAPHVGAPGRVFRGTILWRRGRGWGAGVSGGMDRARTPRRSPASVQAAAAAAGRADCWAAGFPRLASPSAA